MYQQKRWRRRKTRIRPIRHRCKKQLRGFLNRYDFAYTGRDVANQVAKVAQV